MKRRTYPGNSRSTKWRKKKKKDAITSDSTSSSSEDEKPLQCECPDHQDILNEMELKSSQHCFHISSQCDKNPVDEEEIFSFTDQSPIYAELNERAPEDLPLDSKDANNQSVPCTPYRRRVSLHESMDVQNAQSATSLSSGSSSVSSGQSSSPNTNLDESVGSDTSNYGSRIIADISSCVDSCESETSISSRNSFTSSNCHSYCETLDLEEKKKLVQDCYASGRPIFDVSLDADCPQSRIPASSSPSSASSYSSDSIASDESCELDTKDFEAHYLEENPIPIDNLPPNRDDPDDPPGPEDPYDLDNRHDPDDPEEDPGNENGEDDSEESSDTSDEDDDLGQFMNNALNVPVVLANDLTKGDIISFELASAVRHHLTFENILDSFRNLNMLCGPNVFPTSKKTLWKIIHLDQSKVQAHVYCGRKDCGQYIGKKDRLGEIVECQCGYTESKSKAKFFVTLNFERQLKRFLALPGIWDKLQYRNTRVKLNPRGVEDIYDGSEYRRLQEEGGPLSSPYSFSYVFNTDGCSPRKRGSLKMWPLFARLNELPPDMRQKFHFLVALYIDTVVPNFNSFLQPFVTQANILSTRGIPWKPDGENEVISTFVPLCHAVDGDARYQMLKMSKFNSHWGCTYCTIRGRHLAGSMRYPVLPEEGDDPIEERTHAGMQASMIQSHEEGRVITGHNGVSQLMLLQNHNLREGQSADDLHPDHEGCSQDITELMLTVAPRIDQHMTNRALIISLDRRLLAIKTPSKIARKPASLDGRRSFKGSEWRNWLLFFGVPCMTGLLAQNYVNMFSLLSHACFLLSQDSIEPEEIDRAERLLHQYATNFEEKFGLERTKFNLHVTTAHKANCVRKLGPPWCYSTYFFESLNGRLVKSVTSPKGAILQIVKRYLLSQTVTSAMYNEDITMDVRKRLKDIINKREQQNRREVGPHCYVAGSPVRRDLRPEEVAVLQREGFREVEYVDEYKSFICRNTRYMSLNAQDVSARYDDSFVYTSHNTYCTIMSIIIQVHDNGEEHCGMLVREHDVARVLPIAQHISVLRNDDADLLHYISYRDVRCPAIKMQVNELKYATPLPNCFEID